MARTTVPTVRPQLKDGALVDPPALVADGDIIDAGAVVLVVTAGASPTTVTIPTVRTVHGLATEDAGGVVAAGTTRVFGPFPRALFAQPADAEEGPGRVLVDYSSVTDVTRQVLGL